MIASHLLLSVEDVDTNHVNLGVAVLAGLRRRHLDDLARTRLQHDEAVLAQRRALHGKCGRRTGISGLEVGIIQIGHVAVWWGGYGVGLRVEQMEELLVSNRLWEMFKRFALTAGPERRSTAHTDNNSCSAQRTRFLCDNNSKITRQTRPKVKSEIDAIDARMCA